MLYVPSSFASFTILKRGVFIKIWGEISGGRAPGLGSMSSSVTLVAPSAEAGR